MEQKKLRLFNLAVIVGALGYFVDIYDLLLFSIIRVPSLRSLGLNADAIAKDGLRIINIQMLGLLVGGIIWGVLGDKKGSLKVLFASIILYSLGNIANGFVQNVTQYEVIRFITGLGLAGELGAGITLVSELMPKERRGIATSLVAGIGLTGAVFAFFVREQFVGPDGEGWRERAPADRSTGLAQRRSGQRSALPSNLAGEVGAQRARQDRHREKGSVEAAGHLQPGLCRRADADLRGAEEGPDCLFDPDEVGLRCRIPTRRSFA